MSAPDTVPVAPAPWARSTTQLDCAGRHGAGPGSFDERARRVRHEELTVAGMLVAEGHRVTALPERRGGGPVADFDVCGTPLEVKRLEPRTGRPGERPATDRSVANALRRSADQAPVTVLVATGSGLVAADAAAGVARFAASGRAGLVRSVRVVGDGFDLAWSEGRRLGPVVPGRTGEDAAGRSPARAPSVHGPDGRPGPALAR